MILSLGERWQKRDYHLILMKSRRCRITQEKCGGCSKSTEDKKGTIQGCHLRMARRSVFTLVRTLQPWAFGGWGFQYQPARGHNYSITGGADIAMTHVPPKGILDYTYSPKRAGCPHLFTAVAEVKPQIHCFGHVHNGWGARRVTWREMYKAVPTHFTMVDNDGLMTIESLGMLEQSRFDGNNDLVIKKERRKKNYMEDGYVVVNQTGSNRMYESLFVNVAMKGGPGILQLPRAEAGADMKPKQ